MGPNVMTIPLSLCARRASALCLTLVLAACGGGGGGDSGGGGDPVFPASGTYGWVLKATGDTNALKYGLSFVHPSKPETEYVIEVARDVVSDARVVTAGSVDAAQLRTTGNQAHALVYIVGGDVRSVPMAADGSAPRSRLQRAQSTSACRFVIEANDYAAPQSSRYVVSTAGADGQCNNADDGRAEVRLTATGALGYTPLSGDAPLDVVRDPTTLAPRGWIYPRSVVLWSTTPVTTIATRTAPAAAVTNVLASSHNAALVADGTRLAVFNYAASTVTESALDAAITAGSTWQPIGFDANHFYVYINPGADFTSNWRVVKIARANPSATVLASGTGLVTVAGMGRDMLYLTVFGQTNNQLVRVPKGGGTAVVTNSPTTTLTTVSTSAGNVHQRWRVTGVGSASVTYAIDFIDEADAVLASVPGGFPLDVAQAGGRNFNASESRTQFLVAGNYGNRAFGDASLIAYDSAASRSTTLGTLPGTADFGNDTVFAGANGGPGAVGLGFAARSSGGVVQETGAKVFSFDMGVANSLKLTTSVVQ
jgi:hypothetical protein